jgi:hypothetical protein
MEMEEEFVPNLASMLEVSLVEGAHTLLSEGEQEVKTVRFDAVTAIMLVIQIWIVMLCHWGSGPRRLCRSWCLPRQSQAWKTKASRSLELWGTSHPATHLDDQMI